MLNKIKEVLSVIIGLFGLASFSYGAWLFNPAAGFCVLGAACICYSFFFARHLAFVKYDQKKGNL